MFPAFARQPLRSICRSSAARSVLRYFPIEYRSVACPLQHCFSSLGTKKEHIIVALGGNALLQRGQAMTMINQQKNIADCMASLAPIIQENTITLVHGNGPQVGVLVLESAAYEEMTGLEQTKLDVLDAETAGMIGYMIEQEMRKYVKQDRGLATVLSQIVVNRNDPAFDNPTKFIGPVYTEEKAKALGLPVKQDGDYWRRVVPSPYPVKLMEQQMRVVKLLTENDNIVICAGGGGIPVIEDEKTGELVGIEAVIDKDRAACMLAKNLNSDGFLILTDVDGVAIDWNKESERWIKSVTPEKLREFADEENFPDGSMGPKVASAIDFVEATGGWAAIGSLHDADKIVAGIAGTRIIPAEKMENPPIEFHDNSPFSGLHVA